MGHQEHKSGLPKSIGCMVITCSDSRTVETDTSGAVLMEMLKEGGHRVAAYHLVKDEPRAITDLIQQGAKDPAVQAILINGGTGISQRDSTFEAVDGLLEKRLEGFGEIFRYLSFKDIGSAAMMQGRATPASIRTRSSSPFPAPKRPFGLPWSNSS